MTWLVLNFAIVLLIAVVVGTQMIWPAFSNRKLFWWFRDGSIRYLRQMEEEEQEAETYLDSVEVGSRVQKLKQRIIEEKENQSARNN